MTKPAMLLTEEIVPNSPSKDTTHERDRMNVQSTQSIETPDHKKHHDHQRQIRTIPLTGVFRPFNSDNSNAATNPTTNNTIVVTNPMGLNNITKLLTNLSKHNNNPQANQKTSELLNDRKREILPNPPQRPESKRI